MKVHLAINKRGKPVRVLLSVGQEADCAYAESLVVGVPVRVLFTDRDYDVDRVVTAARAGDVTVVISSKCSRKEARTYDTELV
jgi:putative transposase